MRSQAPAPRGRMAKPGANALIPHMRMLIDIVRGLVLAILVLQAATPAMAGGTGGPAAVSCLGTTLPSPEDSGDRSLHAACWACCTAPAILRPADIPHRRAAPYALHRAVGPGAEVPRRAATQRPPARGPPTLI